MKAWKFHSASHQHNSSRLCRTSQQWNCLKGRILNHKSAFVLFRDELPWLPKVLKWSCGSSEFLLFMVWTVCAFRLDFSPESLIFHRWCFTNIMWTCRRSKRWFFFHQSTLHENEFVFTMLLNFFNDWNIKTNNWFWVMPSSLDSTIHCFILIILDLSNPFQKVNTEN